MSTLRAFAQWGAAAVVAAFVTGCGGEYDDLDVSVRYPNDPLDLYSATVVRPRLDGFGDYDPRCDQASGVVPPGLTITNDCTIQGRPTQVGTFDFSYRVHAEDFFGNLYGSYAEDRDSLTVRGPVVSYASHPAAAALNSTVTDAPQITGWTAPSDGTVLTWSYQIVGGSLPPGLTLDPVSGVVSGTVVSTGTYTTTIQAVLTTSFGSYSPATSVYQLQVS